jgi:acetyltransferase-like isoleucine patch superfamily enzyme/dTDP-4-dehydrorhamnose 3,5-epimerase-like enzyme
MAYTKHQTAIVESEAVGDGARIGAFSHILPGARIGGRCVIGEHTLVDNGAIVGDNVVVQAGVQIRDGVTLEDGVFVGANATFVHDPKLRITVKRGASIGANATILAGLTIGERASISAGAVLTHDAPPSAILSGNPARIVGYAGVEPLAAGRAPAAIEVGPHPASVRGVVLHRLPLIDDLRGQLSFGEAGRHVPFLVKRYFLVFGVSSEYLRGEHAHKTLHQFLVCVRGRCHLVADDGVNRQEFVLDSPATAVYLPPMTWAVQYKHSADAVLLVLCSDPYDPADYIREYSEFLALRAAEGGR